MLSRPSLPRGRRVVVVIVVEELGRRSLAASAAERRRTGLKPKIPIEEGFELAQRGGTGQRHDLELVDHRAGAGRSDLLEQPKVTLRAEQVGHRSPPVRAASITVAIQPGALLLNKLHSRSARLSAERGCSRSWTLA